MSLNLATYGLVSALALGGVVAHQYTQPQQPNDSSQAAQTAPADPARMGSIDCNTLMLHHRDMMGALEKMDERANTLLSQMKEATSDGAKLAATMALVETLVTQRKELRDQMNGVVHETIQFVLENKGTDFRSTCPMMTEWLQYGTDTTERHTDDNDNAAPNEQQPQQPDQPQPPQQR